MKKIIKSNGRKILAAILCLITLISTLPISQVLAWTSSEGVTCSSTAGVYLVSSDGGYYYYPETMKVLIYDQDGNTTIKSYKFGKQREKYLLTYNGETKEAFCIEAGTKFRDSDNGYLSENYNNSSFFQNLPYYARYGIMLTAIYGYTDSVPGELASSCNLDDFKCAAQIIIWEYQQQLRSGPWTINSNNGIEADIYYNTIKGRPAEVAYNWLLQKISGHTTIPSFSAHTMQEAQTYTLKYNSNANNFSLTIQDTNNTLADLYFNTDSGVSVYRNGNNYTFTSNNIINNAITITAQKNINKNADNMLIWGRSGYQTCMTGVNDPVVFYFKINTETYGSARIKKVSEDGIVEGIKFRITGNGIDKTVTTGTDGIIDINNLLPGIYDVTEIVNEKYEPQNTQRVTILSGQQSTVTFSNILKRGSLKVTKTSEDGLVENVKFHIYGKSISGLEVNEYATTNSDGIAEFNNILISGKDGYTLEEVNTDIKYVIPEKQNATINWNEVTNKRVNNVLKKFNVTVTKSDVENGSAQGDATLEGAVYGIYNNGQLIDEYTTDLNGQFTTSYYVCGNNWTIKEISPSKGYLLNQQVYKVGAEAKNYKIEYNSTKNDVNEQVIKGKILIIKHTDDGKTQIETPEKGAKFEVYLKSAGSYVNAKETERDLLTCDADGFAETKSLPYGTYTIHQISGWENREFIKDFDVELSKDAKEYKYLINNKEFESYIKMVKKDANTGKLVTLSNATFSLYKLNEDTEKWEQVKCKVGEEYRTAWTTNNKGVACTETKLKAGKYKLCEVQVPNSFVQLEKEIIFEVNSKNETLEYDEDWDAYITVVAENEQPTGTLIIDKSIAINENADTTLVDVSDLSEIQFELTAKENIIDMADGSIIYAKGTKFGPYNLESNGDLQVSGLRLGKYILEEVKTLEGVVLDKTKYEIEFKAEDTTTKVYTKTMNLVNNPTTFEFSKTDITGEEELPGAKLSVLDENGNIIDTWISTNEKHIIQGLEIGKNFILREDLAPLGFVKATDIKFYVEDTKEIQKITMIDKVVEMSKSDIGGNEVEGAKLKVLDKDGNIVDSWTSTKENHKINGLTEGERYILLEEYAPLGFVISNQMEFVVTKDKQNQSIQMIDKVVEVTKVDIAGEEIEGATLQVIDKEGNIVDEWESGKEPHKISGLIENEIYILHEQICVDGYVKAADIEFKVTNEKATQKVEMVDKVVEVTKVDIAGEEIEGAILQVIDKDGNIVDEWISGKEPHKINGLAENEIYILHEEICVDKYVKATDIEFVVTEDKETQKIEMIDKVVEITKVDIAGEEIEGATLQVIDKDGNIVDEWVSGKEPHKVTGLIENEKYILHEEICVDKYVKATDIEFIVTEDKETQKIEMIDKVVEITKTDITTGEELEGAKLQVLDENNNIVDEWISSKEPHKVTGLEENKNYKLVELIAPYRI